MVVECQTIEEFNSFINDSAYAATIVDFHATWCPPCRAIKPFFEQLSKKHTDVQFIKVDVDVLGEVAQEAGIRAMPTFLIYKDGQKTGDKLEGADQKHLVELVKKFSKIAPSSFSSAENNDNSNTNNNNNNPTQDSNNNQNEKNKDEKKSRLCRCSVL
jgi:thioredoxin 1